MYEILSMPRHPKTAMVSSLAKGLPINSLPGWENIPLNRKLPMLKCPTKQVIFSKSKIGENLLKNLRHEFNNSIREEMPEYNALHDPNLKPYYSNQRNLLRLRQNGEITHENDVVCTLKEFNKFREDLHNINLYSATKQFHLLEDQQRDRVLIANAEVSRQQDYMNVDMMEKNQCVKKRKLEQERARKVHYEQQLELKKQRFKSIAEKKQVENTSREHKKQLHEMRAKEHLDASIDLERKRIIRIKKQFDYKNERFAHIKKNLVSTVLDGQKSADLKLWERRMKNRIERGKLLNKLLKKNKERREQYIEQHRQTYQRKWEKIQNEIQLRAKLLRKQIFREMGIPTKKKIKRDPNRRATIFDGVHDTDLGMVLHYSVDPKNMPFDSDDPMYKAANFIVETIVHKFNQDLTANKALLNAVIKRLDKFFDECREDCVHRSLQLISAKLNIWMNNQQTDSNTRRQTNVSFDYQKYSVGVASYAIHPNVTIKSATERLPTPRGSLSQIPPLLFGYNDLYNKDVNFLKRTDIDISTDAMLFVEHLIARFKRELLVAMGRRTFRAIRCHFENKITPIRKELLEINKEYLLETAAKGILGFAVNKLNFHSSLRLCSRALGMDVIYYLQKNMLNVKFDPRCIPEMAVSLPCDDGSELKICNSSIYSFKSVNPIKFQNSKISGIHIGDYNN